MKTRRRPGLRKSLRALKKKRTKQEEFPKIRWKNLEDPLIQKAELIYSDRVNLHRDLLKLDRTLDESPTPETIAETVEKIALRAPLVAENYRTKLAARMQEALAGVQADEARILTEAAVFADKANIDEELTRLRSHIGQFRAICKEERVGRKLDFLVQEFNREANTICSKSNDLEVTSCALALKNEIEKIREQVQNVE